MSQQNYSLASNAIKPHDDAWMVKHADRVPLIEKVPDRFKKTEKEKAELLTAKRKHKAFLKGSKQ